MKKIIALSALSSLLATASHADLIEERCRYVSETAEDMMTLRQMGDDMSGMIDSLSDWLEEGPYYDLTKYIIIEAFKIPRFELEEYQRLVISDFKNEQTLLCYSALE